MREFGWHASYAMVNNNGNLSTLRSFVCVYNIWMSYTWVLLVLRLRGDKKPTARQEVFVCVCVRVMLVCSGFHPRDEEAHRTAFGILIFLSVWCACV